MSENKSPNAIVKDKDTRILLDRRAEIREQINKLEAEYQAIEHIIIAVKIPRWKVFVWQNES